MKLALQGVVEDFINRMRFFFKRAGEVFCLVHIIDSLLIDLVPTLKVHRQGHPDELSSGREGKKEKDMMM